MERNNKTIKTVLLCALTHLDRDSFAGVLHRFKFRNMDRMVFKDLVTIYAQTLTDT